MADEQDEERVSVLRWPLKWLTDEKFWRDTFSGALAAMIAAFAIWVAGVLLGYFQNPQWQADSLPVLWWVAIVLAVGSILISAVILIWPGNIDEEGKKHAVATLITLVCAMPLLVYGVLQA
ncbi:hypothetical protein [Citricoccus sp.]|uniref:hypothetical protein n=1 Tax=Citricoccus sp. TaxID=1978372 RepID=UPI002604AC03|nr:hypothetical protein [Citricoccus sp.]HRO31297.1 hypothetical protein [Citricoccus sp.]